MLLPAPRDRASTLTELVGRSNNIDTASSSTESVTWNTPREEGQHTTSRASLTSRQASTAASEARMRTVDATLEACVGTAQDARAARVGRASTAWAASVDQTVGVAVHAVTAVTGVVVAVVFVVVVVVVVVVT